MFAERPSGPLFYQVSGTSVQSEENSETIIFLHGVAVNHEMWRHWVPTLADRFRLLMLELRRFGQSSGMTDVASWTIDDVSDDILAVADQEGIAWWSTQMMDHRFVDGVLSAEEHDWFQTMQDETMPEPLLRAGNILLESDLTAKLGNIKCPLLLISADRSPFVTPDIPVEILNAVPSAQLCIIPGSKHGIPFSHGSYCAGQFLEFLGRCKT